MASTLFYDPRGKPITAEEFMERLFGKLPALFKNEAELRRLWSHPATRKAFLEKLAIMQSLINAENSNLFDVLEYVPLPVRRSNGKSVSPTPNPKFSIL